MGKYNYTDEEKMLNKVIKYNQDMSYSLLHDEGMNKSRAMSDDALASSRKLLASLGM